MGIKMKDYRLIYRLNALKAHTEMVKNRETQFIDTITRYLRYLRNEDIEEDINEVEESIKEMEGYVHTDPEKVNYFLKELGF